MVELLFIGAWVMPFVVAAALGLVMPLLLLGAYRSLNIGLAVIGVAWVAEVLAMTQPVLYVGVHLHVADLPMVLIACAATLRWLLARDMPRRLPAWLGLLGLFAVGVGWGLGANGKAGGVEARPDFLALAAASYVMSFPIGRDQVRALMRWLLWLALAGAAVSAYRWVVYYLPIPALLPPGGVYNVDGPMRVVPAATAMAIAQLLVLGLFFGAALALHTARWLAPVWLGVVLALQHRSVWLAGIAGTLVGVMLARAQRAPLWQQLAIAAVVATVAAAPPFFSPTLSGQLGSSAERALAGRDTVADRLQNWRSTLRLWAGDGPAAIAVGRPRGSDMRRAVGEGLGPERMIEYQAHNHYVNTVTQMGVAGLALYLWLVAYAVAALVRSVRRFDDESPHAAVLLVALAMQLTFFVAYGTDFVQYTIFGFALAWAARLQRERRAQGAGARSTRASLLAWR